MTIPATISSHHSSTDSSCCSVTNRKSLLQQQQQHQQSTKHKPSMHPSLPMSARTGRTTARYTPGTNRRLCAGVVALSTHATPDSPGHHTHVLVTSSSRHPERFVLPKGGWEQDETAEQSALREGWEEGNLPSPAPQNPSCEGRC
jgi:NUDIX domain